MRYSTPDFAVFLVRDSAKDYRRDANAGRRPPLAVSCRRRHRLWDAGDRVSISRRKKISPRTDLDDRPRLGGKTPPSPGRRVPVDSPEDRRFSNRSKSHRRCRHAMETSHGRSDGRSDAGYGGRVRLGTAGDAPTGFRKNRVNGGSSYDSRTCVYVSSDFHIGQNRVADAGTRRKLRTNVPSDVPAPAIDAPTGFCKNRVNAGVTTTLELVSMYHQISRSVESTSQMPALAGNLAWNILWTLRCIIEFVFHYRIRI